MDIISYSKAASVEKRLNPVETKLQGIEDGATADQTKADIDALGIDSATVNGKTVDTSVPAGAVFTDTVYDDTTLTNLVNTKQDTLESSTNIKTIEGVAILGSGDLVFIAPELDITQSIKINDGIETNITINNGSDFVNPVFKVTMLTTTSSVYIDSTYSAGVISFTCSIQNIIGIIIHTRSDNFSSTSITQKYAYNAGLPYRYLKITNMIPDSNNNPMLLEFRAYEDIDGAGAVYPSVNLTSNNTPTPYVVTVSYEYSTTYSGWKAFDSSTISGWWLLASADKASEWLVIDLGSSVPIKSVSYKGYSLNPAPYTPISIDIYGSNTGAFGGEEVFLGTLTTQGIASNEVRYLNI